jgi:hypothetical protein
MSLGHLQKRVTCYSLKRKKGPAIHICRTPPHRRAALCLTIINISFMGEPKICSLLAKELIRHEGSPSIPAAGIKLPEWTQLQCGFRAALAVVEQKNRLLY